MLKKNAPIKSTSGEGFSFEDKIVAFHLCHVLAGTVPYGIDLGRLTRIDCQVRSQGWEVDDVLLTFDMDGRSGRCALSVKSNRQFTNSGAPKDLIDAAWAQLLGIRSSIFEPSDDLVGIATVPHPPEIRESLNELFKLSRGQDPTQLETHMLAPGSVSNLTFQIYNSFRCPFRRDGGAEAALPGALLQRMLFREFDFLDPASEREASALSLCEQALVGGGLNEAKSLWEALLSVANKVRTAGGYVDLPRLLSSLRSRFALRRHPDFEEIWHELDERNRRSLGLVQSQLGGVLHIDRPEDLSKLTSQSLGSSVVFVRGPSGSGKSALVKSWIGLQSGVNFQAIWLRGEDLQRLPDRPLGVTTGRWPLAQLLASSSSSSSVIVVDGLENCYSKESYHALKGVVDACNSSEASGMWKIILTCQAHEWPRVQTDLLRFVSVELAKAPEVEVRNFSEKQFSKVVEAFPGLRPLLRRKEIRRLLLRPKVLDLLITHLQAGSTSIETAKWIGEADLVEWWWTEVVEQRTPASRRSGVLRDLAEKLADKLESECSMENFSGDEETCTALARDGVCHVIEGRIRFAHDLYGDWARQRRLLQQGPALKRFLLSRLTNPLWQKALRLVALHLLERRDVLKDWGRLFADFAEKSHICVLARDLLLDAAIFAADPQPLLEKLWPELAPNAGELLRRFLNGFLHSATVPDFRSVEFFEKEHPELVTEVAARFRLPYFPYWIPILRWLNTHVDEVISLAADEVAKISKLWLSFADGELLDRNLASELAVRNAERIAPLELVRYGRRIPDETKTIYEAALAAAGDLPDRVSTLALILSGRKSLEKDEIPVEADPESLGEESELSGQVINSELADHPPQPWPDGPRRPVSRAFQAAFIRGGGALPLIQHRPGIAAEVTLALLISWPKTRMVFHRDFGPSSLAKRHGFQFLHPEDSFYTAGPFLLFLRNQPEVAVDLIIKLVNFATERCMDVYFERNQTNVGVRIPFANRERIWFGDSRVYFWFRYPLITAHIVGAALMALEKWMYETLDSGGTIENTIAKIFEDGKSVAFAGVLALCW